MKRAIILKNSLTALFRSGADEEHTAEEMRELLEGIDFLELADDLEAVCAAVAEHELPLYEL